MGVWSRGEGGLIAGNAPVVGSGQGETFAERPCRPGRAGSELLCCPASHRSFTLFSALT